jgi:hypothetical protein
VTGAGDPDERCLGEGHAHRFALTTVDAADSPEAAREAGIRDTGPAVRADAVAVRGRRDDQIALDDSADVAADLLDHTDELVADGTRLERRLAAVLPEVAAAHTGQHDANDGVGGLDDDRVGAVRDLDRSRSFDDRRTHGAVR